LHHSSKEPLFQYGRFASSSEDEEGGKHSQFGEDLGVSILFVHLHDAFKEPFFQMGFFIF
jgi:hypothetical protein